MRKIFTQKEIDALSDKEIDASITDGDWHRAGKYAGGKFYHHFFPEVPDQEEFFLVGTKKDVIASLEEYGYDERWSLPSSC